MKQIIHNRFRVTVECGSHSWDDTNKEAQRIRDEIKRHVDFAGSIYVENDSEDQCSFCKMTWEVDKETGCPVCCHAAVVEWTAAQEART